MSSPDRRHYLAGLFALILGFALPASARAHWTEARSPNFIVYSDGDEAGLRRSVERLEEFDGLLRQLTGTTAPPSPAPLKVYLVASADKLRQVEGVPPGVLGFYRTRVGGTAAFAVRGDRPGLEGEDVLFHEYAHHFAMRYYPAYYPPWFSEGFAEYVMTARFGDDRIEIGRYSPGRAITLLKGQWLSIDRVLSHDLRGLSPQQVGQFYAESWLVVHYLFNTPERRERLQAYLAELQRGTAEKAAFQAAFGFDHRTFEAQLKSYMQGRIPVGSLKRPGASPRNVAVRKLPDAADDLLLRHAALSLGIPDPALQRQTLIAVRNSAGLHPEDAYARRVLARAEIAEGDSALGTALVDELLRAMPDDAELLYLRGLRAFYAGRKDAATRASLFGEARPWFEKAVAADPAYYTALFRLAQTAPGGTGTGDDTLRQLTKAHDLAPLVGDIAIDTALAFSKAGQPEKARIALLPIANDPHGGNRDRARAMLDQIRNESGQP